MAIKPISTLRDILNIYEKVEKTSAKVTEMGKEVRDLEARLTGDIQDANIRLVKVETRLQMIYDIAVARASGGQAPGPQAPPALTDERT